ncbi:MAG: zinc ribbon domain-containing protein [Acidobacteria bacterium]|nr:zinc ribbon domain-containing protein [Acidobacteriota bacterium]
MFCPQCGQQQLSGEVRFCSRCGFLLKGVTALLASGGEPPTGVVVAGSGEASPRRRGVRRGGQLMLLGIFLGPFFAILHELIRTSEELALVGAIAFLAGLLRLVYALCFEDGPLRQQRSATQFVYVPPKVTQKEITTGRGAPELPPAQGMQARGYVSPRVNTAEISYRPSVTENTTRLLPDQPDEPRQE